MARTLSPADAMPATIKLPTPADSPAHRLRIAGEEYAYSVTLRDAAGRDVAIPRGCHVVLRLSPADASARASASG